MVSIENKVFNDVAVALQAAYSGISVYGEYIDVPESFPCVTLMESDSYVARKYISTSGIENATDVTYEVNVYSNKKGGKKTEAKQIANSIDGMMALMGFARTFMNQVPNVDRSIYRIVMRYQGRVVATTSGSNTKYKIYRKD